jgi:hypothetical protein
MIFLLCILTSGYGLALARIVLGLRPDLHPIPWLGNLNDCVDPVDFKPSRGDDSNWMHPDTFSVFVSLASIMPFPSHPNLVF